MAGKLLAILLVGVWGLVYSSPAGAEEATGTSTQSGSVASVQRDSGLSTARVRATGIGRRPAKYRGARARLMAERAAQIVAARNLLAKLTAAEEHKRAENGYRWLRGRLVGHRYLPTTYRKDGTAEVTIEVTVTGPTDWVNRLIAPPRLPPRDEPVSTRPVSSRPASAPATQPAMVP